MLKLWSCARTNNSLEGCDLLYCKQRCSNYVVFERDLNQLTQSRYMYTTLNHVKLMSNCSLLTCPDAHFWPVWMLTSDLSRCSLLTCPDAYFWPIQMFTSDMSRCSRCGCLRRGGHPVDRQCGHYGGDWTSPWWPPCRFCGHPADSSHLNTVYTCIFNTGAAESAATLNRAQTLSLNTANNSNAWAHYVQSKHYW